MTPDIPFIILKLWYLKNVFPSGDDPLSGKQAENGGWTDSFSLGKDALGTPRALLGAKVRYCG